MKDIKWLSRGVGSYVVSTETNMFFFAEKNAYGTRSLRVSKGKKTKGKSNR